MKALPLLLFGLSAAVLPGQRLHVNLDTQKTEVHFTLGDVLHTVHGTFKLTQGDFWFDSSSGKAGGLLSVDAKSGDSGSHARDHRMNNNVLESDKYSQITFAPDRIEGQVQREGESEFGLHGTFTLHGAANEVTMHVKNRIAGKHLTANAGFDVPYVKWGLKNPSTLFLRVNEVVSVTIDAVGEISDLQP